MNFIGKIFVVLILVMSVVFMAFAVAVYGTHQNWKEKAEQEAQRVANLQTTLQEREDEKDQLQKDLDQEKLARKDALAKVETERAGVGQTAQCAGSGARCVVGEG